MASRIVSSRIDEQKLAKAEALTQASYGMSFGKYCGTVLADAIYQAGSLPHLEAPAATKKLAALDRMKAFASAKHNTAIGQMGDERIKDLIAGRYV